MTTDAKRPPDAAIAAADTDDDATATATDDDATATATEAAAAATEAAAAATARPSSRDRLRDLATIALLNLAALGLIVHRLRDPRAAAVRIDPPPPPPTPTAVRLAVHVTGAVRRPAVVRLPEGARVADAVAAAGGLADDASPDLNLAAPLSDGAQVDVPRQGEAVAAAVRAPPAAAAGDVAAAAAAPGAGAPIDVNRADAAALDALPGVGPALAARIVAWRSANGPFRAPEDLLNVSGIGDRTLERLRAAIVVR